MAKKAAVIMPQTREILAQMGEQIRACRDQPSHSYIH